MSLRSRIDLIENNNILIYIPSGGENSSSGTVRIAFAGAEDVDYGVFRLDTGAEARIDGRISMAEGQNSLFDVLAAVVEEHVDNSSERHGRGFRGLVCSTEPPNSTVAILRLRFGHFLSSKRGNGKVGVCLFFTHLLSRLCFVLVGCSCEILPLYEDPKIK